jgi:hypothetical protein
MLLKKIVSCARCGEVHENVETKRLTQPVYKDDSSTVLYSHWAPCPTNGEPILVVEIPNGLR